MILHILASIFTIVMLSLLIISTVRTIKLAIIMMQETKDQEERLSLLIDIAVVLFAGAVLLTIIICAYNMCR